MTTDRSKLIDDGARWPFSPADRADYPAFAVVPVNGSWRVSAVVTVSPTPLGGWYASDTVYRLQDGGGMEGRDLYLDAKHAEAEAKRRNGKRGGWDGVR